MAAILVHFALPVTSIADIRVDPVHLEAGGAVVESQLLAAGQSASYIFQATETQSYLVQVEQRGLDFTVIVRSPDGVKLSYNSPLARDERELILLEDAVPGEYQITLISEELTDARGSHAIKVSALDTVGDDTNYLEALRLTSAAAAAWAIDDWAKKEEAHNRSRAAVPFWERSGRSRDYAQALYTTAFLKYWVSYDNPGAVQDATRAAAIYLDVLKEQSLHANAVLLSAAAMLEDLQFDAALVSAAEALSIHEKLRNGYDAARTEELIGYAYHRKGELTASVEFRRRAADHFTGLGEWFKALTPRARVAIIEADKGYSSRAIDTLEDIRRRLPEGADPFFVGEVLAGLGDAYRLNGSVNEALTYYDAALDQHRRNGDVHGEAGALRGIGMTYLLSGHLDLAADFLLEAAETAKGSNIQIREQALTALGTIDYLREDYRNALDLHQQALALLGVSDPAAPGQKQAMSKVSLAYRNVLIGRDLTALGRHEEARNQLEQAKNLLAGIDSPFHHAAAEHEMGRAWLGSGELEPGVRELEAALAAYQSIGSQEGEAAVLHDLARANMQLGSYELGLRYGEIAIERIESMRTNIAKPDLRALFSATRRGYYATQVDLLLRLDAMNRFADAGFLASALTTNERSRARMTMDLIAEASVNIRRGVDPDLRARQQELRDQLAARVYQQESPGGTSRQTLSEMAEIEHELTVLENEIRLKNPFFLGLSIPETLNAAEFHQLLDSDTVLLQYALGSERSFVWAVTQNSIHGVELAGSGVIETAARELIAALRRYPGNSSELNRARNALSALIVQPVAQLLSGTRIVVVADGVLHYIPFSVLTLDADKPDQPLVLTREIVGLPSMSVLSALRSARGSRPPPRKSVAVLVDPVLSRTDPRLSGIAANQQSLHPETADSQGRLARSRYLEEMSLDRLSSTEYEARIIEDLVPPDQRLVARGFDANRARAMDEALGEYRYLHFATHAMVNTHYPGMSRLFLANFDSNGNYASGTLLLDDIFNLQLNADLVVLSACDTALGQEIRGEGLVGFAQGFLYAGTRSLIVSLWPVPDRATAELMTRFYSLVLREDSPPRPAQALQMAQSSMASERRWRDPYLWAAFVLLGDWR